jgi:hypothetical protein
LVDAVRSGDDLDLSRRADIDRTVGATVLRDILLGKYTDRPAPYSLRLSGALIKGDLDLTGVQTDMPLTLNDCRLSGLRLNEARIPQVTLRRVHWGGPSDGALSPVFRFVKGISGNAALTTVALFTFLAVKLIYVARGDITTALGVFNSAGLATVIVGGLLSSLPLVAASVLGITSFALTSTLIARTKWFRREVEFEWSIFLAAFVAFIASFFLATWQIMIGTIGLGAVAGLVSHWAKKYKRKRIRFIAIVAWVSIFVFAWLFILQPMMIAVWLPHEELMLKKGHASPEVGYVLDDSNSWISLLRTRGRRIVRIPSDHVVRRSLCHIKVFAGSEPLLNDPNTAWHNLASKTGGRLYTPTETELCPSGQNGPPSSAG